MKNTRITCMSLVAMILISFVQAEETATQEAVRYFNEGVEAQKRNQLDMALISYAKSSIISQDFNKYILLNKGVMYARQGNLSKAKEIFIEVLRMDPNYKSAQFNLGLILDRENDRLTALEYWVQMFHIDELKPKDFILEDSFEKKDSKVTPIKTPSW